MGGGGFPAATLSCGPCWPFRCKFGNEPSHGYRLGDLRTFIFPQMPDQPGFCWFLPGFCLVFVPTPCNSSSPVLKLIIKFAIFLTIEILFFHT